MDGTDVVPRRLSFAASNMGDGDSTMLSIASDVVDGTVNLSDLPPMADFPVDKYRNAVRQMAETEFEFVDLAEEVTSHPRILSEVGNVKEHFAKLKFNYLEMEAKQAFLAGIAQTREHLTPPASEAMSLDSGIVNAKSEMRDLRETNNRLRENIEETSNVLADGLAEFDERRQELALFVQDVEAATARAEAIDELKSANVTVDLADAEAALEAQTEDMQETNAAVTAIDDAINLLEMDAGPKREHANALETELATLRAEAAKKRRALDDDVSAETREMSEWYTHMSAVVSSFSGMSIAPPDYEIPAGLSGSFDTENALVIRVNPPRQAPEADGTTVAIFFKRNASSQIDGVQICDGPVAGQAAADELCGMVKSVNDLPVFFAEIKALVKGVVTAK